ncbi:class I SAM-dependent methyltransferase [Christiangramia salexigens]|uniref:SAM-dependent methyltransferase n=1 Tax=Christiangramia salexigens TaxID=1913577 RepID=A0A1L3J4P3_9FLAO|nr:class I SAM-dependent methyltransferase [Christiangramia salexigens]APG60080.1 SAM-dependent methyltransferase [Christiangramia salexigens]
MDKNKDIFGKAITAFYYDNDETDIIVHSPDFDDDVIPVKYLFREYDEMPVLEQEALDLCSGKVLDVGCGAGGHSLYLQKTRSIACHAIDTSPGAIEVARKRGVKNAECVDFFNLKDDAYDTILMLMNGSGIIGKLNNLDAFFKHARSILTENGKIILDSSDLVFLFEGEEIDQEMYYGELEYLVSYKNSKSDVFDWLYIDEKTLEKFAKKNDFSFRLIRKGKHFDYLAVLEPLKSS